MRRKVFIKTFGCQMNEYDSNRIADSLSKINFEQTSNQNESDCYILNTCHIRDKAKEKVYHEVGRVKKIYRNKKKPIMVIAGCVAQAENDEMFKREPFIDIVIGPQSYHKINNVIQNFVKNNKYDETDIDTHDKFKLFDNIKNNSNKISSFLTIQEGCDKFCHFCVVPFTRGPEYSRPFKNIIHEAEQLVSNGVREITLLGQNVNAYFYKDKSKEYRISDIIKELENISELLRIRYTTSHPIDMTDDLLDCYKNCKKLMPFIHLPIQSGSNNILEKMNRKHTVEEYLDTWQKLLKINKDIKFSSDFIVGYPGETHNDFEETLKIVKKVQFINSFSFIYSPRPGTTASEYDQIETNISKERLKKVQDVLFSHQRDQNKSLKGKNINVLVENKILDQNKLFGRNIYLNPVIFDGSETIVGKIVKVNIKDYNQNTLFGELIEKKTKAA